MTELDCADCRKCGGEVRTMDSRPVEISGVKSIRRRKVCRVCGAGYKTIEVPEAVAHELWVDD